MATILFYPPFPDQRSLCDQLFRAVWHFSPMADRIDRMAMTYIGGDSGDIDVENYLANASSFISDDFDKHIASIAPKFSGRISIDFGDAAGAALDDIDAILVWDTKRPETLGKAQSMAERSGAQVVVIDPDNVQQETLEVIRFAYSLWETSELSALVENAYSLFLKHVDKWQGRSISAFGNGPSLKDVVENKVQLGGTVNAICNSTIGDEAALAYLDPEMLFCGDPVQHCGVSKYAGEFRVALAKALENPNRVLFTQLGYVPYFRSVCGPDCHDRIIGIGNDRRAVFNLDLRAEFLTASTANIFTMLVLPVACTVSKDINIYGCDGMSFVDSTRPWSHSNEDDYMGRMAVTHRVHSGFWKRNYEEEYWSYGRDLSELLRSAEAKGHMISVRTPSYVPALGKRYSSD